MESEKKPIFINYPEIHSSPIKRLLILKSLIKIINTQENFVSFEDLGLKTDNADLFKRYLSENFSEYFDLKKKTINLFENYDGKIICGIDCLLDDIFSVLNNEELEGKSSSYKVDDLDHKLISGVSKNDNLIEEIESTKNTDNRLKSAFKWIFFDYSEPVAIKEEMQIHLNSVYQLDEDKIIEYFNSNRIFSELLEVYKDKDQTKRKSQLRFVQTRGKLLLFLEDFERKLSDKRHWSNLKNESLDMFKNISDSLFTSKRDKLKIFLIIKGDPNKNRENSVISYYNNKVVLFSKNSSHYRKLQPQQIVLAELLQENPTSYIFNPKRILTNVDALQIIELGVETCPNKEQVLFFLKKGI